MLLTRRRNNDSLLVELSVSLCGTRSPLVAHLGMFTGRLCQRVAAHGKGAVSLLHFLDRNQFYTFLHPMSIIEIFYSSGFPHNPHLSANYTPIIVKPALVCQMQFRSENSGFLVWDLMALKFSLPIFKCSKRQSEEALTHGMG